MAGLSRVVPSVTPSVSSVRRAVNSARCPRQDGHGEGTQELEQEPADPQPRVRHTEPCGHRLLRGNGLRDRPHGAGRCPSLSRSIYESACRETGEFEAVRPRSRFSDALRGYRGCLRSRLTICYGLMSGQIGPVVRIFLFITPAKVYSELL